MSRAAGLCRLCGGPRRGRAARTAAPVARCEICGSDICPRHALWSDEKYYCLHCARERGIQGIKVPS